MNHPKRGSAFDAKEWFSVEDVARAMVFDLCGKYVPAIESALNPVGKAYHDWIAVVLEAAESGGLDYYTVADNEDFESGYRISFSRDCLVEWCRRKGIYPAFLFPDGNLSVESSERAALRVLGAVLKWIIDGKKVAKQGDIVDAIESLGGRSGLGKTLINETFSAANKEFKKIPV